MRRTGPERNGLALALRRGAIAGAIAGAIFGTVAGLQIEPNPYFDGGEVLLVFLVAGCLFGIFTGFGCWLARRVYGLVKRSVDKRRVPASP